MTDQEALAILKALLAEEDDPSIHGLSKLTDEEFEAIEHCVDMLEATVNDEDEEGN